MFSAHLQLKQHLFNKHLCLTTSHEPAKLQSLLLKLVFVYESAQVKQVKFVGHPAVLSSLGNQYQGAFAYHVHLAAWLNNNNNNHNRWIPS